MAAGEGHEPAEEGKDAGHRGGGSEKYSPSCLTICLIGVGILLVLHLCWLGSLSNRVSSEMDAIRAAGYPTSLSELDRWYKQPEGKNAADIYKKAFRALSDPERDNRKKLPMAGNAALPPPEEPIPPDMEAAIREYLNSNDRALELLHDAAEIDGCRYPVNLAQGFGVLLPHLQDLRDGVRLLSLRAALAAHRDQPDIATKALLSAFAVGRSLKNEPLLISELVRIGCDAIVLASLESTLARTELRSRHLSALREALEKCEMPDRLQQVFIAERAFGVGAFQRGTQLCRFRPGPAGGPWLTPLNHVYRISGVAYLDELAYLDTMETMIDAAGRPWPERMRAFKAGAGTPGGFGGNSWIYPVTHQILPGYTRAAKSAVRHAAKLRAARAALAVAGYQLEHGELPEELDALTPGTLEQVPRDPADGKQIRLIRKDDLWRFYSIGPDGKDDGGTAKDQEDVVFDLHLPPPLTAGGCAREPSMPASPESRIPALHAANKEEWRRESEAQLLLRVTPCFDVSYADYYGLTTHAAARSMLRCNAIDHVLGSSSKMRHCKFR